IQMRYEIEGDEIVGHRLCYLPCPVAIEPEEITDFGLIDIIEVLTQKELTSRFKLVTPIRFDFDIQEDDVHAASHVTAGKNTCRIPAFGPLSVGHFMYFVLGYFYNDEFQTEDDFEFLEPRLHGRTLFNPPGHRLFVDTSVKPYGLDAEDPALAV